MSFTPYRQLAPTAAVRVSPLCLGTMTFGDKFPERFGEGLSDATAFEILDYYYDNGGNFIDTANTYQEGHSEEVIGKWLKARGNRDEIVLATKYSGKYNVNAKIQVNTIGNSSKSLKLSVEKSLERLQTSYIDLLYVHWWDYTTSIPEVMLALNDLVKAGKVLYLGVSDSPAWVVSKANEYARNHGLRQFSVYQGLWNAAIRDFERDIIPMAASEGLALAPWGTLNQGKFQTEEGFKAREKKNPGRKNTASQRDKDVSKVLEKIAKEKGETIFSIALAYVFHKAPYVFPIVGARNIEHIKGDLPSLKVRLSEKDIEEIDSAYEFDPGFPHTFLSRSLFFDTKPQGASKPSEVWLLNSLAEKVDWVEPSKPIEPSDE
ncbi:DEKNAAC101399 [Brettanomyces naardenensis]|uniref:DEKNAAC101399 n=1 Tax=Brettanomyces naardenensis TaxID=13370 RepID=A0A448YIG2_BRENA|nr:DEKNAAC101399 [Brettanomyces naardenensis]